MNRRDKADKTNGHMQWTALFQDGQTTKHIYTHIHQHTKLWIEIYVDFSFSTPVKSSFRVVQTTTTVKCPCWHLDNLLFLVDGKQLIFPVITSSGFLFFLISQQPTHTHTHTNIAAVQFAMVESCMLASDSSLNTSHDIWLFIFTSTF